MSFNQQNSFVPYPLVWFLLVDADGVPYKGVSVDYVMLPPGFVVAQLRDAVKAKQHNFC
jgi:hypothetical protein